MRRIRNGSGLGIIEVMVSLLLFFLIAAGLSTTTIGTIQHNAFSRDTSVATALIQDRVEQLSALPADALVDWLQAQGTIKEDGSIAGDDGTMDALGEPGTKFHRTWAVTPNSPSAGVGRLVVTVEWNAPELTSTDGVAILCLTRTCRS